MDISKEIHAVVRKSLNHWAVCKDFEESIIYSESLCNELADKIEQSLQKDVDNYKALAKIAVQAGESLQKEVEEAKESRDKWKSLCQEQKDCMKICELPSTSRQRMCAAGVDLWDWQVNQNLNKGGKS